MLLSFNFLLFYCLNLTLLFYQRVNCSTEEERLLKKLFKGYNKLIRPVKNASDHVVITMDLVLLQLINVYEKEQIMKTNVWLYLKWRDFQFDWAAKDYKVGSVRVPNDRVWTPDIVLFNNADGNYEASFKPNVVIYADADESSQNVNWIPPAIYKSSCTIDVKYFPFDEQVCEMRFGSWTFDSQQVRLRRDKPMVNLQDYLPSGTWDVISAPGEETYSKETNRMELVYHFRIRRKTLFYTVNLIIPTVLISFLSIFVFYLPTDEGEKMTLCISILLALVVFLLLVSKILPPTSMVIPLISKYLIFTLMMNIVTILNTVIIINWNYRTPRTHNMPRWVRVVFIEFFPKILFMKRPNNEDKVKSKLNQSKLDLNSTSFMEHKSLSNKKMSSLESNQNELIITNRANCSSNLEIDSLGANTTNNKLNKSNRLNTINHKSDNECSSILLTSSTSNKYADFNSNSILAAKPAETSTLTNYNRPKQQQHKNLDKLFINTRSLNRAQLNNNQIQQNRFKTSGNNNNNNNINRNNFYHDSSENESFFNRRQNRMNNNENINLIHRNQINSAHSGENLNNSERGSKAKRSNLKSQSCSLEYDNYSTTSDDDKQVEFSPEMLEAADKITYITNHIKSENDYEEIRDDWKYVALVIDRLQLYIFFLVTVIGTAVILFDAPHIFQFVDQQKILKELIENNKFT